MNDVTSDSSADRGTPDADIPDLAFEYPKEVIISYAQTREDVLLWRALHSVNRGFYIDVGAHDPTVLSVTRAFYDRGWLASMWSQILHTLRNSARNARAT